MPGITRGFTRFGPGEARVALRAFPAALEIVFDFVELAIGVTRARFPAVLVRRLILGVIRVAADVRARCVVLAPVTVFDGRIHLFSCLVSRCTTGDCANGAANQGTGRPGDGRANHCTSGGSTGRSGGRAYWMRARLFREWVAVGIE